MNTSGVGGSLIRATVRTAQGRTRPAGAREDSCGKMADESRHVAEAGVTAEETADLTGGASGGGVTGVETVPGNGTRTGGSRRVLPLNSRRLTAGLL